MRSIKTKTALVGLLLFCSILVAAIAQPEVVDRYRAAPVQIHGVNAPEDLIRLPGTKWIVVSSMRAVDGAPGHLYVLSERGPWTPRVLYPAVVSAKPAESQGFDACPGPPDADQFFPHGIDVVRRSAGSFDLYVINHGGREAVERFRVTASSSAPPVSIWTGCVVLPPHTYGNGVAVLPGGGLVVSNMYDPSDQSFMRKFASGSVTGNVLQWTEQTGWRQAVSQGFSGANGVAVAADGHWLFVSEWSARRLWRFSLKHDGPPQSTSVDFLPDNLRWTAHGTLLLAGQNAAPERVFGCGVRRKGCPLGFTVAAVNPASLKVTNLMRGGDARFGGGTGAVDVGHTLWVASFRGEQIGRFEP